MRNPDRVETIVQIISKAEPITPTPHIIIVEVTQDNSLEEIKLHTPTPTITPSPSNTSSPTLTPTILNVISVFDERDTEGWSATNSGIVTNPGKDGFSGLENDGYLLWYQGESNTSYYLAPSKFLGNWLGFSTLQFSIWWSGGSYYPSGYGWLGDIYLANGDKYVYRTLPKRPSGTWETFTIPLTNSGEWTIKNSSSLEEILRNVTEFRIRAEYGLRDDKSGLDNVELLR